MFVLGGDRGLGSSSTLGTGGCVSVGGSDGRYRGGHRGGAVDGRVVPSATGLGQYRWVVGEGPRSGQNRSPELAGPVVFVWLRYPTEPLDDLGQQVRCCGSPVGMAFGGYEVDGAQSPQHGLPHGQVGFAPGASGDRGGQVHELGGLGEFGQGGGPAVVDIGRPLHCGQGRRVYPI